MASCDIDSYKCSDVGLILPLTNEYTWSIAWRTFVYIVGLLWCFLGISLVADIFMGAIETITSKRQRVKLADPDSDDGYKEVEILSWNGTVANLTLMALGSSAPEILLSVIEIVGGGFKAGALGPGTIVGSAAFNLMCITGICIMAIPANETRKIKHIKVFAVTAVFSIFAYIWLIIVLLVISPDYIEVWEAIVTLFMFPIMVVLAYIADKDYCGKRPKADSEGSGLDLESILKGDKIPEGTDIKADQRLILEFVRKLKHEKNYDEKDIAQIASYVMEKERSHSRGWYRRNAIRNMTGSAKLQPSLDSKTKELLDTMLMAGGTGDDGGEIFTHEESRHVGIIEFAAPSVAVLEKDGRARVTIMRHGNLKKRIVFRVDTIDGTAESGSDYVAVKKSMVFEPNQTSQDLEIDIVDDNVWEPDEVFFVRLTLDPDQPGKLGKRACSQVVILNDDDPGTIQFEKPSFLFKESCGTARVPVSRVNGADGRLVAKWKTKDISAVGGKDYENTSGQIEFKHGEVEKHIEIVINDDLEFEKDENFELQLQEVSAGAKIGKKCRTVVTIVNDDEFNGFVSRIANLTNANLDALRVQRATWGQQFVEAMNVNGGDIEHASILDYVMHFFTFAWKILFAFIPPASIWGGWLCFIVSLVMIGVITCIVGDLAGIFGCLIGLRNMVTAITFVALGTSLPDLFASKTAAVMEKTADNSIGNITGSNGVNVFLGLGVSWILASLYWAAQGKSFEVPAGQLGFTVIVFTLCGVATIALLLVRRYVPLFGGELGGPKVPKIVSGILLIGLWIFYVLIVSMQVYEHIPGI